MTAFPSSEYMQHITFTCKNSEDFNFTYSAVLRIKENKTKKKFLLKFAKPESRTPYLIWLS